VAARRDDEGATLTTSGTWVTGRAEGSSLLGGVESHQEEEDVDITSKNILLRKTTQEEDINEQEEGPRSHDRGPSNIEGQLVHNTVAVTQVRERDMWLVVEPAPAVRVDR
jgi:hypothetical protein